MFTFRYRKLSSTVICQKRQRNDSITSKRRFHSARKLSTSFLEIIQDVVNKIKKLFYGGKCISTLDNNNEYVIVGGGMVAGYTVNGIRKKDMNGSIFVVSKDADVP